MFKESKYFVDWYNSVNSLKIFAIVYRFGKLLTDPESISNGVIDTRVMIKYRRF